MTDDSIVAISTPPGEGGISIVRLSGKESIAIVEKIFEAKDGKNLSAVPSHTVHYGYLFPHKKGRGEPIDEVLVTIMLAPHSYTGENVIEISCHGGIISVRKILETCLKNGARLAEPGEFTKRAFLNGKIDLAQAEAVCDIISAKTEVSLSCAVNQLKGSLSAEINKIWQQTLDLIAHLETSLDFSEEHIQLLTKMDILKKIKSILLQVQHLLKTADYGQLFKTGLKIALVGKPNVGKSSLLNAILKEERVIVTPFPGTTRDMIEVEINIAGLPVKIMDTAGIRSSLEDAIEKIGVQQTKKAIAGADLILFLLDISSLLDKNDFSIAAELSKIKDSKKIIVVLNKCDLKQKISKAQLTDFISLFQTEIPIQKTSASQLKGIKNLETKIHSLFIHGKLNISDKPLITNLRHKNMLIKAADFIKKAQLAAKTGYSEEFIILDLRNALNAIGEITGKTVTEELLDTIFSNFCIGK